MEGGTWHPEFGGWMIESTPSRPYNKFASDLLRVERNMIVRRRRLLSVLAPDEIAPYVRMSKKCCYYLLINHDITYILHKLCRSLVSLCWELEISLKTHSPFMLLTPNLTLSQTMSSTPTLVLLHWRLIFALAEAARWTFKCHCSGTKTPQSS